MPLSSEQEQRVMEAYAAYDSDPRVHGIDDADAFREAVTSLLTPAAPYRAESPHCDPAGSWAESSLEGADGSQ